MAGGIAALLLKADDKNRWSVILHHANGRETILPSATPAEHLITASEIDYSAYRREIRNLREHHPLFEERIDVSQADFEDFVAEALLLPSMIRDIDPVGYFVLVQLIDQSLRQEDDGSASFLLHAAAQLLQILEEPLRAQVYLRNALEIACDGMERATQQERYQKLVGTYPELQSLCDPALLPDGPSKGQVYAAYSILGLLGLEFALYFHQDKQRIARCDYCWLYFIPKTKKETHYCDRETDGFPCKQRGSRFKRNLDAEQDEALLACKRLRDRMYARLLRYTDAHPNNRKNLISMDYDQYDSWSENARLARIDYLDGKLTAEEFLRKIDTMHDLEDYTVGETQALPMETAWQRMVAGNIGFDPELHYPEGFMLLDLGADDPKWQTFSADDLRRRDQEGHQSLREKYGKK